MKRRVLAAAAPLLLALAPAAAPAQATDLAAAIDGYAREHDFSGTILVRDGGRILHRRSYGPADRAFAVPVDDSTRFRVASITKLFAAVLVLQLAQEGKLSLDGTIVTYLPDYPGGGGDRVTLHQLLNHTSGIANFDGNVTSVAQAFAEGIEQYQRPRTPAALLRRCCSGPLAGEPGKAFDYNNADYIVLGNVVERVTGKPFAEVLAERILRPLGLRDTGMLRADTIVRRLAPTYFWRDDTKELVNDLPVYIENWYAAGAMYSTAGDLATFADALFGGRLVSAESLRRLLAPGLDEYGYGLWSYSFTRDGATHRVAKRPGRIMGANAVLYRFLDRDTTVILLANTNRADLDEFAQRIANLLVGQR
ncbi:MAG TPA: serine hydrolase domain-containing protein [Longimicrobium sp.]|nr:serine hydrolase domain-containing protein [Longimicrobium sp.]